MEHKLHLQAVLALLKEHQLFANRKKCTFEQSKLEYLGHIISGAGVAADPKKVEVMLNWPTPKDLKAMRGFLGLTGYCRRSVKDYGKIARPLTQLLQKDNFQWNPEAQASFEQLKKLVAELPILTIPDFSKTFTIETDASNKGLGQFCCKKANQWLFSVKPCQIEHKLNQFIKGN